MLATALQVIVTIVFVFSLIALIPFITNFPLYILYNVIAVVLFVLALYGISKFFKVKIELELYTEPKTKSDYAFYITFLVFGMMGLVFSVGQISDLRGIIYLIVDILLIITFALWVFGSKLFKEFAVNVFFIYRLIFSIILLAFLVWNYVNQTLDLFIAMFFAVVLVVLLVSAFIDWKRKRIG